LKNKDNLDSYDIDDDGYDDITLKAVESFLDNVTNAGDIMEVSYILLSPEEKFNA